MNENGYIARQAAKDAAYRREYEAWVRSMPPAERAKLKAQGLDQPMIQGHGNGMLDQDAADTPLASEPPNFVELIDEEPPSAATVCPEETIFDVIRRLIAEVLSQGNARLTLECLAVACGLTTLQGESMSSIAKRHGISRAAVSKRCVDITEKLNLPPSRAMKTKKARLAYRKAQIELTKLRERLNDSRQQS